MKLAILGADPAMLSVAQAAVQSGAHLVWGIEPGAAAGFLRQIDPRVQLSDDWESLLAPGAVDGVLVAKSANEDLRADQLRKLVQERVPLLLSHPLLSSMLVCYELDMIRRETGCPMLPCLPVHWSPGMARLIELCGQSAGNLGRVEQVAIERFQADRGREAVFQRFAVDIDLARVLAGELTHLTALAVGADETRYANLGVQLSGPQEVAVRWTVRAPEQQPGARLSVHAASGRAELWMPDEGDWLLKIWRGEQRQETRLAAWNPAGETWSRFQRLVAGEEVSPTWVDACRAVELTETIDRSLKKSRTIELHYEDYSEQGTFKGTMTSLGCGLLMAALAIMLLAALAGNLAQVAGPLAPVLQAIARHWAKLLLAILGLFLGLQALRLVFAKTKD